MFADIQHLLKLTSPAFGNDSFVLTDLQGQEAVSSPYQFQLETFSSADNIDVSNFLGQSATIEISNNNTSRTFNGLIVNAQIGQQIASGHTVYHFRVAPWLWILRNNKDHQRFENKTVVEVFSSVCNSFGMKNFDTTRLSKTYKPQKYMLQYNETTLNFVNRILAENGIYYRFSHTSSQHTMVLFDSFNENLEPSTLVYSNADNQSIHIHDWLHTNRLMSNQVTSNNYNYETPTTNLLTTQKAPGGSAVLDHSSLEQFSYPGQHADIPAGKAQMQQAMDTVITNADIIEASSNCIALAPGFNFNLSDFPEISENQQYVLLQVEHIAHDHSYLPTTHDNDALRQSYANDFNCVKSTTTLKPSIDNKPAMIYGSQSIKIDGATPGQLNADSLGRVKGTFFWQHDNDMATSTYALRVLQPIAGKQWGMQFIPRVGDEVIVRYLYGDPMQPLVIGSLHNAAKLPYYQLPNQQNNSGLVSRTVGGSITQSHQLTFDDTKNQELMRLVSSNDMSATVTTNMAVDVTNNIQHATQGNTTHNANQNYVIQANQNISLSASGSNVQIQPDQITMGSNKILLGKSGGGGSSGTIAQPTTSTDPLTNNAATGTPSTNGLHYYLALQYPNLANKVAVPVQSFTLSTQTSSDEKAADIQSFRGNIADKSIGSASVTKGTAITHLQLNSSEVISINHKALTYPQHTTPVHTSDWQAAKASDLPGANIHAGDQQLQADVLFPPIIKHLRQGADKNALTFTDDEVAYFKQNGNNAMVFIHGYNVPPGDFASSIINIEVETDPYSGLKTADIIYGASKRTVYCDNNVLKDQFPTASSVLVGPGSDALNGTDAHNWFIHMEDNLNRATNQFKRNDYTKYTRCIHIAWDGDVGALNFISAAKAADSASESLLPLLRQLLGEGIAVNIIAHSLGNRVLLGALNSLGKEKVHTVEHVFMWDAAVSELALSNTPITDNGSLAHPFSDAMQAVKKVTVLYNQYDTTLAVPYWLAVYFGVDMGDKLSELARHVERDLAEDMFEAMLPGSAFAHIIDDVKQSMLELYPKEAEKMRPVLYDRDFNHLIYYWAKAFMLGEGDEGVRTNMNHVATILQRFATQFNCAPALGLEGLKNQPTIQNQLKSRYTPADMSKYATGHSYMRVPSEDVMVHGYQTFIINQKQGVAAFGLYSAGGFPNNPAPAATTVNSGKQ